MIIWKKEFFLRLILILVLIFISNSSLKAKEGYGPRLLSSDSSGIEVELSTPNFQTREKKHNNITYQIVTVPAYAQTTAPGKPQVPLKGVLLAIPLDSAIGLEVMESEYQVFPEYNLFPAPRYTPISELQCNHGLDPIPSPMASYGAGRLDRLNY